MLTADRVKKVAAVVAHPDDETLWAGGTILAYPDKSWDIFSLTRASDDDRAPRFRQALSYYGASGAMADKDDGREQNPLNPVGIEMDTFVPRPRSEKKVSPFVKFGVSRKVGL